MKPSLDGSYMSSLFFGLNCLSKKLLNDFRDKVWHCVICAYILTGNRTATCKLFDKLLRRKIKLVTVVKCSCILYPYSTQAPNPSNCHELTNIWIRTQFVKILTDLRRRSQFLQFVGLSGIRLKSFERFKTLATNSLIRKFVRDPYQIPNAFLDIVTES